MRKNNYNALRKSSLLYIVEQYSRGGLGTWGMTIRDASLFLKCSKPTAKKALSELADMKLITIQIGGTPKKPNYIAIANRLESSFEQQYAYSRDSYLLLADMIMGEHYGR